MFLGIVLGKEGEFRAADEAFTKSIRLNDKNSLAYFQRGLWRIRGGQIELAIQDLEKTMELDPMNVAAWTNLIRLKAMLGEQKPR
jgi:tetratricopeptide (TPR) repeat protein